MALDPFPGLTGLPVSLHPYLYAFDNPLRYTDPSGQIPPLLIALAAGALIGGGISYGSQVFQNYQNGLSGPNAWIPTASIGATSAWVRPRVRSSPAWAS